MNLTSHRVVAAVACLVFFVSLSFAQPKKKEPPKLFTESKSIAGKVQANKAKPLQITGTATYQITACNSDDTLTGVLTYALAEKERQQLALALNQHLDQIPSQIAVKDIEANYAKGTQCPVVKLEFPAMGLSLAKQYILLERFTLDFKETQHLSSQIICTIARQIGRPLTRRGPCRKLNEILNGVEEI